MPLADDLASADHMYLEARYDRRNIHRGYRIDRSMDLFGHHIVEWWWGRVGTAGRVRRVSFSQDTEANRFVRKLLQRRDTAPRRLGISYQPIVIQA